VDPLAQGLKRIKALAPLRLPGGAGALVNPGETCGVDADTAALWVARGAASYIEAPGATNGPATASYPEPPLHKMIETAPNKRGRPRKHD
jgi:hypothetical protein